MVAYGKRPSLDEGAGGCSFVIIRVVAAIAAAVVLGTGGTASAAGDQLEAASPFGAYLAAQHAAKSGDYSTASAYFRALIGSDQKAAVIADAIKAFVASGEVATAEKLSRELDQTGTRPWGLAIFLRFAGDVLRNDMASAEALLDPMATVGGLDGYLVPVLRAWISGSRGPPSAAFEQIDRIAERGVLISFFNYHAARILDHWGEQEAAGQRYRAAIQEAAVPDRMALAALAHFSATGQTDDAIRARTGLAGRRPASGTVLALQEGAELRSLGGLVNLAVPPAAGADRSDGDQGQPKGLNQRDVAVGVAETFFDGARMLFSQQFYRGALAYVQIALYLEPDFLAARLLVAQVQEQLGATDSALASYRRVPSDAPEAWDAGLALAALLGRLRRVEEARSELQLLGERFPGRVGALSALGQLMATEKRYDQAIAAYSEALDRLDWLEPHHWPLLYGRGAAFERSGLWERAEEDLQRALELSPDQPFILNYLAYSWIEQGRRLEEAKAMAALAARLRPDNGFIIDSLGWAHYRLGDYELAVETLERAMAAQPGDPVITSHYGDALWRTGRKLEARMQWRNALRADPDPELAAEIEWKLEHGFDETPPVVEEHEI